jgi:hypothetical protein
VRATATQHSRHSYGLGGVARGSSRIHFRRRGCRSRRILCYWLLPHH